MTSQVSRAPELVANRVAPAVVTRARTPSVSETGASVRQTGSRITVLGAGICGLFAGMLLRRDGHEVTILERDRAGAGLTRSGMGALDSRLT